MLINTSSIGLWFVFSCMLGFIAIPSLANSYEDGNNFDMCIETETEALLLIKEGLANTSDWLSSWIGPDCCRWRGVSCDNMTGHVTELHLAYPYYPYYPYFSNPSDLFNLEPSKMHASLSQLKHLRHLDLSCNNFNSASIPNYIDDLNQLVYLNLSYCHFGGEFPQQLGNLSNLQVLDLNYAGYHLVFHDLHWLSKLTALEYLDMSMLNLSRVTPEFFKHVNMIPSLEKLYVSSASLVDIPETLPHVNFTSLLLLDLSFNFIYSDIPETLPQWIFNISSLQHLDLSFNEFLGGIPVGFSYLTNLRHLDLSENRINISQGTIETLKNPSNLVYLGLGGCQVTELPESISNFTSLQHLLLPGNNIIKIPESISSLSNLKTLHLYSNKITSLPESISSLSNLKALYLASNKITSLPEGIGSLKRLEALLLTMNKITSLPESIGSLSYLKLLHLSSNEITSLPETIVSLRSLETLFLSFNKLVNMSESILGIHSLKNLDLSSNEILGMIPRGIGNLCNLQYLDLSNNSISGDITELINGLSKCFQEKGGDIVYLGLGSNKLNGTVPESLGQLLSLQQLDLSHNALGGTLHKAHFPRSLTWLDISYNQQLEVSLADHDILPFTAVYIFMCNCKLGPKFPSWLRNQTKLERLCISWAEISDEIPSWFWDQMQYIGHLDASHNDLKGRLPQEIQVWDYFDVSSNKLEGPLPRFSNDIITFINLSNNSLSGPIPQGFAKVQTLRALILSANRINGTISEIFCNMYMLMILDLSYNELAGSIPDCWNLWSPLRVLDFSNNSLVGEIPFSIGSLESLQSLQLNRNGLTGKIPSSFKNLTSLTILDLGENKLFGAIPNWTRNSSLKVLSLRSNHFDGDIPLHLSILSSLQVLDLALNSFTGTIPPSFVNFRAMNVMINNETEILGHHNFYKDSYKRSIKITAGQSGQLQYNSTLSLVTSIDVSYNRLSGEIPKDITKLHGLLFLKMSGNQFAGKIPTNIGEMTQQLSLDISENNLSGEIPNSMTKLTLLNNLNLSYNILSGKIPFGGQLQLFDESEYLHNFDLCGLPLQECFSDRPSQYPHEGVTQMKGINDDKFENLWVCISFVTGFIVGFWLFVGMVLLNRARRIAYYNFLDDICDMMYLMIFIRYTRFISFMAGQIETLY